MGKAVNDPTRETLLKYFDNELLLENSIFVWKVSRGSVKKGTLAGTFDINNGYWKIMIEGKSCARHRLLWIAHFGPIPEGMVIDHIDDHENGLNDHISNLQMITLRENTAKSTHKNNSNVYKYSKNKWIVQFNIKGKKENYGVFDDYEEAVKKANTVRELIENGKDDLNLWLKEQNTSDHKQPAKRKRSQINRKKQ